MPKREISPTVFSILSARSHEKIEQLIIQQENDYQDDRDQFELPKEAEELKHLKLLSVNGKLSTIPIWIGNLNQVTYVRLSGFLHSLPESIGNLHQLASFEFSFCPDLQRIPESIGNLHPLSSLNLS